MVRAFLLLGSNEGDRRKYLSDAITQIGRLAGTVVVESSLYQTAAWGKEDQAAFYNQVIGIDTNLAPALLLQVLLKIEGDLGRVRKEKWGSRTIDIDILFYGDEIVNRKNLTIPHPGIPARRFTLVPLAEIVPEMIHPALKKSIRVLLDECSDPLAVEPASK